MKLSRIVPDREFRLQTENAAQNIVDYTELSLVRPCAGCHLPCACSGSSLCRCGCAPDCPYAARQMSSDPDNFPIEAGILPLVFAFNCLGACHPFWSCEGHMGPSGKVNRLPRVWFYARSVLYPRLITEYAVKLHMKKLTNYPWYVTVTHSDAGNLDTAFSLEPNIAIEAEPSLASLHADIGAISENLVAGIKQKSAAILAEISAPAKKCPYFGGHLFRGSAHGAVGLSVQDNQVRPGKRRYSGLRITTHYAARGAAQQETDRQPAGGAQPGRIILIVQRSMQLAGDAGGQPGIARPAIIVGTQPLEHFGRDLLQPAQKRFDNAVPVTGIGFCKQIAHQFIAGWRRRLEQHHAPDGVRLHRRLAGQQGAKRMGKDTGRGARLRGNRVGQGDHILHLAGEVVSVPISAYSPPPTVGGVDGEMVFQVRYHPAKALMIVANPMHQDQGRAAPAAVGGDAGSVRG
jgi:hypothetical protein